MGAVGEAMTEETDANCYRVREWVPKGATALPSKYVVAAAESACIVYARVLAMSFASCVLRFFADTPSQILSGRRRRLLQGACACVSCTAVQDCRIGRPTCGVAELMSIPCVCVRTDDGGVEGAPDHQLTQEAADSFDVFRDQVRCRLLCV